MPPKGSTKKTTTGAKGSSKTTSTSPKNQPTYVEYIIQAIHGLKSRTGASRQAVKKYLEENVDHEIVPSALRLAFAKGVQSKKVFRQKNYITRAIKK